MNYISPDAIGKKYLLARPGTPEELKVAFTLLPDPEQEGACLVQYYIINPLYEGTEEEDCVL